MSQLIHFDCPNCEEGLVFKRLPQLCEACGYWVKVFPSQRQAQQANERLETEPAAITTGPARILGLGWALGMTRLMLA